MVPSLTLLSRESSVSVKENPDRKKKIISGVHSDKDELEEYCAGDWEATSYIYRVSNFGFIMGIATLYSKIKTMDGRSVESVLSDKETIHKKLNKTSLRYISNLKFYLSNKM